MRAPQSWLAQYLQLPSSLTSEQIAEAFIRVGFEVEAIERLGEEIKGPLVVGKVLAIEELTGHKKPIRYVTLDCGEGRDRFVICGARNFEVEDFVVVALPGAILPGNFAISSRETYGRISDGMICSAKELGMGDDHSGIIVLPATSAKLGEDAIDLLELRDTVFDISVNPDRGYALSIRGLARELAGAFDIEFQDPAMKVELDESSGEGPVAEIEDGASEIFLRSVSQVTPGARTPLWMSRRIEKCGMRSISLPVDITNYLMLELGQPLHAFDSALIKGALTVRNAKSGEKLRTLDGVERDLTNEDLVIADGKKVLALAGTMGGEDGEVEATTTSISIEAAHFFPERVAKNARRHRLSTEASRRFERFVDPLLPEIASARAVELLVSLAGARYLGTSRAGQPAKARSVEVELSRINALLGKDYSAVEMSSAISRIGASAKVSGSTFAVSVPSWRPDLIGSADFAEEVARIHGYDSIPMRLPVARVKTKSGGIDFSERIRRRRLVTDFLAARGFAETQNYPFTSQGLIDGLGFEGARARTFKLANPLSDELPVLRTHILQSLLVTTARNLNRGNANLSLFEVGSIFRAPEEVASTPILATGKRPDSVTISSLLSAVPAQPLMVAGVVAGNLERSGWWGEGRAATWNDAIAIAGELVTLLGSSYEIVPSDLAPWHPGRCAELRIGSTMVAHAGELHPRAIEMLGLPKRSIAFALLLDAIPSGEMVRPGKLATMPPAIQDVSLVVDVRVPVAEVIAALTEGAGELLERIELFDRYEKYAPGKVSLAFTLTFRAPDRTLESEEIAKIRSRAVERAREVTGAELRS
jgi:phenylalanyl-tRNA synthetase beta chain